MSLHFEHYERRLVWRHRMGQAFEWLCRLATLTALSTLALLLVSITWTAMQPGRAHGLAQVVLTSELTGSDASTIRYQIEDSKGGHFVLIDQADQKVASASQGVADEKQRHRKVKEFTVDDVRQGRIRFDNDGRRKRPVYNVTVVSSAGEVQFTNIQEGRYPDDALLPLIQPLPAPKPWGWLTLGFLRKFNSYDPFEAGICAGLWGSIWLIGLTGLMAVPLGIGAAVYLEEYAKPTRLTRLIQLNIANLAGVPSIVYGILGFTVFSRMFGAFDKEQVSLSINPIIFEPIDIKLPLGPVLLSGACTLALLSLPVIIISSQEALKSVPASLRHAAYALGATKWQTIWHQVLPAALPGILTGVILSLSRAIGEAAPLAVIGVAAQLSYTPGKIDGVGDVVQHPDKILRAPFDRFTTLPIQVYSWINETKPNFEHVAAAGILVLLATLLTMNSLAILIRHRFQQKIRW